MDGILSGFFLGIHLVEGEGEREGGSGAEILYSHGMLEDGMNKTRSVNNYV